MVPSIFPEFHHTLPVAMLGDHSLLWDNVLRVSVMTVTVQKPVVIRKIIDLREEL